MNNNISYPKMSVVTHSYNQMIENFKKPPEEYNPVLMWFWNDNITKEGITYQLTKFRQQNFINFFIHPAGGLTVTYLSDRFFELIKHAVAEAKRLGMKYWIYDEFDWPSGVAGGALLNQYPQYNMHQLRCEKVLREKSSSVSFERKGEFISAALRNKETGAYSDVTEKCTVSHKDGVMSVSFDYGNAPWEEELLIFMSEPDTCVATASRAPVVGEGVGGYLDILSREACAKFIEMTHEKYKEHLGDEFGKTVMGVFTDEPTTLFIMDFEHPICGPWNKDFLKEFEKDHGYDLTPYFTALFYPPKTKDEEKARENYRHTVKRLYIENFAAQVSHWCQENGLIFTGHVDVEETLRGYMRQGDTQKELTYMGIPGIDSIYSALKIWDKNFFVAGKLVEGAAKFAGKDRVLCESYTISGTDFRFPEMKRIGNRLMTLGVNMIQYMGAAYSNADNRKAMAGSVGGYFNTLFPFYNIFNSYAASVSYLSAATKPDNKILVFIPLTSFLQTIIFREKRDDEKTLQDLYEDTVNGLLQEGIGYELISEEFAENIKVYDGYMEAFGYRYETAVFPAMKYITEKTSILIDELLKHGVKVLFIDRVPEKVANKAEAVPFTFNMAPFEDDILKDGNAYLIKQPSLPLNFKDYKKSLKKVLGKSILNIESDLRYYITERANDAAKVYFIANDDERHGTVTVDYLPGMKFFSAETKEEAEFTADGNRATVKVPPFGMVVAICDKNAKGENPVKEALPLTHTASVYPPNQYDFEPLGGNMTILSPEVYDEKLGMWRKAEHHLFPQGMTLGRNQTYKLRANVNCGHVTFITDNYVPEHLDLNIETRGMKSLSINGVLLDFTPNIIRWSEYDAKIDLGPYLKPGYNNLEAEIVTEALVNAVRPPFMFLSGDFNTFFIGDYPAPPLHTVQCGDWCKQGFKYFSGTGAIRTTALVDAPFKKAEININTRDVAEVYINGKYAGTRIWGYEQIDITEFLVKGENRIEVRITVPLSNIFGNMTPSGIMSPIEINLFN